MPDATKRRWNADVLWGLLLATGALVAGAALFTRPPMQAALPWLSLMLAVVALAAMARGLWRAMVQSQLFRGKVLSIVLGVITLAAAGLMIFGFFISRSLPGSAEAPQVGQQVPGFSLPDISGQPVSLDNLLAPASGDPPSATPKAVLLIFYRGYW